MNEDRGFQPSEQVEAQGQSRRRRRPLSCIVCRRRKLKCDRSLPCAQCIKSKTADSCTYAGPRAGPTSNTRSSGTPPRSRLQTPTPSNRTTAPAGGLYVFDSRHKSLPNQGSKSGHSNELQELRSRVQNLENALSVQGTIPTPETLGGSGSTNIWSRLAPEDEVIRDLIDAMPEKYARGRNSRTRVVGRSDWTLSMSFFRDIQTFMKRHIKSGCKNSKDKAIKQFKSEIWSRERLSHQRAYQEQSFELEELVPPREMTDELLSLYLRTFETTYRVLHIPTFLKEYEAYWSGSQPTDMVFLAKLLALMAASSCFYNQETKINGKKSLHETATGWTMAVQSWIASVFVSPSVDFHMLQIKCLLMIAGRAITADGDVIWVSAGSLVRSALAMGMHRDPGRLPYMTKYWAEMRRRLWATICELEMQSSLDSAMLPSFDLDECDCDQPSNWDDEELSENMVDYPAPKALHSQITRNSFQVLLSRSLPVRFRIIKVLNSLKFALTYDEALRLTEELLQSLDELLLLFHYGGSIVSIPEIEDTSFTKSFLIVLIRKYLLALHQPYFVNVQCSAKLSYSRKVCVESALEMLSQLEPFVSDSPGTQNLGGLAGGMFRNELFRAAITLCVEMSLQADEFQGTLLSRAAATDYLGSFNGVVRSQQSVMLSAVERTLEMFRNLIKPEGKGCQTFFFLTMVLASVKARLGKEDPLKKVEEASTEAVRHCTELMTISSAEGESQANDSSLDTSLATGAVDIASGAGIDFTSLSEPTAFSPLEFGNLFDMYDYGMPELWNNGFSGGF
ncbi:MAPEG family [Aspergillus sclerotialis]|uniref:MAPEG family n=1 Tax=Aspergillus sclerotialis TaxID=2070753 RepID=A0A3A2ZH43_9EURO|nr:MAPEG family [Aspergillus sclerotialis]